MSESKKTSRVGVHDRTGPRSRTKPRKKHKSSRQAELPFCSWGGAREGAGRKRKSERPLVPHVARPQHTARFPVLVTSRLLPGLPSLRRSAEAACVLEAIASSQRGRGEDRRTRNASGHETW